jgi:hypothetical protein
MLTKTPYIEALPHWCGSSNKRLKENFFFLCEEKWGDKRMVDTGRVSLMPTTTRFWAGSHFRNEPREILENYA